MKMENWKWKFENGKLKIGIRIWKMENGNWKLENWKIERSCHVIGT